MGSSYSDYAEKAEALMSELTFGVELEIKGLSQRGAAQVLRNEFGSGVERQGGDYYRSVYARDAAGREWRCMSDASVHGGCEVVTPILKGWEDLELVLRVARALRAAGATVDTQCGLHVHVGANGLDGKGLVRLTKLVYSQEDLIVAAFGIQNRVDGAPGVRRWCSRVDEAFIQRLPHRPDSVDAIGLAYYGGQDRMETHRGIHYSETRYRGLNLHNLWYGPGHRARGTVEFRYFNGTLHGGRIKTAVQFCLAVMARAQLSKGAAQRKRMRGAEWSKYDMRVVTLRLGMMGDRFSTARKFLMDNLGGSSRTNNTGKKRGGVSLEDRNRRDGIQA